MQLSRKDFLRLAVPENRIARAPELIESTETFKDVKQLVEGLA